jgi:hypothetical protein
MMTVTFPTPVRNAVAVLTGFVPEFSGNNDHHIGLLQVQVKIPHDGVKGNAVTVDITFALRDSSNNWFHHYDGTISFAVVAD